MVRDPHQSIDVPKGLVMKRLVTLAAALFLASPLMAHELVSGDLQIIHPHIPQPAASAMAAGGYMAIVNTGDEADRLVGVESAIAAKTEVHESKVDENGVGTMSPVEALEIPAGGTVSLERGGYHIMFMGLTGKLTEGEMHKAVLIFEKGGRVEVEFQIDPPMGSGDMDHSKMDHSTMGQGND
jgi:copper(I)-binding protein